MSSTRDLARFPADATRTSPAGVCLRRVYVWDLVVRTCHWTLALTIFALSFTGFYIGHPFIIVPGAAGEHFVMGWMKAVHFYLATVFVIAVAVRIYWSFFGTRPARWTNYIPSTRQRFREMKETLLFYLFLRKRFPAVLSHNPLAGITYSLVVLIFAAMIFTGLGLYGSSASVHSPLRHFAWYVPYLGGLQLMRWVHHAGMWLLLGFFVHHIYSAALAAFNEKNGILESIFTGYKWVESEDIDR